MNFKLRCFPFHRWDKWISVGEGEISTTMWHLSPPMTKVTGRFIEQRKVCLECGELRLRREVMRTR